MDLGVEQSIGGLVAFSVAIALLVVISILFVALYAYTQRRLRAAVGDAQDVASLAAARDRYTAEIEQATRWRDEAREELLRLEAERADQERLRSELSQLELRLSEAEQKAEQARKEAIEAQYAVTALADDRDRLTKEVADASATAATEKEKARELENARAEIENALKRQTELAEQLANNVRTQESTLSELRAQVQACAESRDQLDAQTRSLETRKQALEAEIARLNTQLELERSQLSNVQIELAPIREQARERLRLETEIRAMEERLREVREETEELTEAHGLRIAQSRYSDLFEVEPRGLADDIFPGGSLAQISEQDALESVARHLEAQKLIFPRRVLWAFHTSLKVSSISPITVLAGISGTGKSELPLRYAEAMGMHSLAMAVQPSWSSPQDLFGFYNYLEKRYKATELARALVRMDAYNFRDRKQLVGPPRSDRVLLVLIDEMNLARVEYYFSEFLSRLEARRAVSDPEERRSRAAAEIELEGATRASDGRAASDAIRLWVGGNVLFAGTMNEDESTQSLSDKVLDRANVLRFGKPPKSSKTQQGGLRSRQYASERYLPHETWNSWIRPVPVDSRWRGDVVNWIEQLNGALSLIGRPFGWRVKEAVLEYVANYPGIDGAGEYLKAMADQVEQKVLPKLRGVDLMHQQTSQALNIVLSVLEDLGDERLLEAFRECQDDKSYGTFNWRGVTRA